MAFEKKWNRFVLFLNDRKEPGSDQADRTGTLDAEHVCSKCGNKDQVSHFMDAWLGETKNGKPYLNGKIKAKTQQTRDEGLQPRRAEPQQKSLLPERAPTKPQYSPRNLADDEIPF